MILVWLVAVLPTDHEAIKPNNHDSTVRVALILDVGIFQLLARGGGGPGCIQIAYSQEAFEVR
jgi:hypothetical protein